MLFQAVFSGEKSACAIRSTSLSVRASSVPGQSFARSASQRVNSSCVH